MSSFDTDNSDSKEKMAMPAFLRNMSRKTVIIGGSLLALVVFLCLCGGMFVSTITGNITEGNNKEATLSAAYSDGANYLSNCVTKTHQAANVAQANAAAFDKVIKDAIAGTGKGGQFNLDTKTGQTGFFPLLVQAYPDLKGQTDLFSKVLEVIVGCRDDFRNKQSVVLDQVRGFNAWRTAFWTNLLGGGGFPDENLYIAIPGVERVTGEAALHKMEQPIVEATTSETYKDGVEAPSDPFATATPAPSAS